ncbi:Hypothetical predicted protein [Cloeon dipterum]|uniref:Lipase domain-containing protein n=1 Tax=Cloeon dipterum TaxID=197152 RepID=A0A8S1BZ73_9INSE|nr:Hypothetical predicted protein [Cloeon dipterum]
MMKLLVFLSVVCLTAVNAAPTSDQGWIVIPGVDGKRNLALLDVPDFKTDLTDPYTQITFHLYTRSNRNTPVQIFVNNLNGAPFDAAKANKFVIHGFTSNAFDGWAISFKDMFLDQEDCNVICVDWSEPAQGPLYNEAKANVKPVGEYVAQLHDFLASNGHSVGNSHCIGHSLGAHVCGFSGKASSTGTLGRVTGMDPALPLFSYDDPSTRLASTDASYVDVIHTCAGWLGFERPLGHADFYPNGGSFVQPGCGEDLTGSCSHARSHDFFLESITSNQFVAKECDTWDNFLSGACAGASEAIMGNPSNTNSRGTFYLATSGSSPFALG